MRNLFPVALAGALAVLPGSAARAGFTINASYDSSWNNTTAAKLADVQAAVNTAIGNFEGLFSNNVSLNIVFQWGVVGTDTLTGSGAASLPGFDFTNGGTGLNFGTGISLNSTETLFTNHASVHPENAAINAVALHLPTSLTNPALGGSSNFAVTNAEYEALTAAAGTPLDTGHTDGYVGFGTGSTLPYFLALAEHEIAHVMGRVDYGFAGLPMLTPLDFFKYDSSTIGTADAKLDPTFTQTAFSIDGGKTNSGGYKFSGVSDSSDWTGRPSDPFNYATNGNATISSVDITEMQALGWDPIVAGNPVPEPGTSILFGTGMAGLLVWQRRKRLRLVPAGAVSHD